MRTMGLFTKEVYEPQGEFRIDRCEAYDEKGQIEEEYHVVREKTIVRRVNRFTGTVKHRRDYWDTLSEYEWIGFKSELGPRRIRTGAVKFSLEGAKEYIEARKTGGPINEIVATPVE